MSQAPLILALDVSKTRTGIAFGRAGEKPKFISIRGDEISTVKMACRILIWMTDFIRVEKPDYVFFEAPMERAHGGGSIKTIIILNCLAFLVEVIAEAKSIACRKTHVNTLRKAFIGSGNTKADLAEKQIGAMCRAIGWEPKNHDEADAAVVWHWGCLQTAPRHAAVITPMLQSKVAQDVESSLRGRRA
jgi:hypothetical protein